MNGLSRRELLNRAVGVAGTATVGLPLVAASQVPQAGDAQPGRKLKVVVTGAHPDKIEIGCGGTIARYTDLGHQVTAIYLTRGERGEPPKTWEETGKIREAEARKACEILKARPVFVGQVNGMVEVTYARYDEYRKILEAEKPDIVFSHWPLDRHEDQRANASLVFDAWLRGGKKFALYYYEVMTGHFTLQFSPTHYVDITGTEPRKRQALYAHASKDFKTLYDSVAEVSRFRGDECGRKHAEGFIRHAQSPDEALPLAV
jgi:LmbE family N-acetylglucosaminyl deacetylase